MRPRSLSLVVAVAFAATVLVFARPAFADGKTEAAAKALDKKAMDEDYLGTDFAKAQEKLEKAIAQCGTDKCSATIRAQLRRDLGVVLVGGQIDKDKGIAAFAEAVKLDPNIQLDPDLKTKDLEAAFEAAKKNGGGGAGGGGSPTGGDFTHTPIAAQQIRTPVPIYVEYGGSETLAKVIVRYKGFGMSDFKPLELKKVEGSKGWGGVVPCTDVTAVGQLQYYVQGFNDQNDPVAVSGDRNTTYKVSVQKEKIDGEAPHLPGQPAPTQCADTGDCPPDFPGCKKTPPAGPVGKDEGETCSEDTECKSGLCKKEEAKKPPPSDEPTEEDTTSAPPAGVCTAPTVKMPRIWVGLSGSFSVAFVPSASDVCKLNDGTNGTPNNAQPTNSSNYYCIDSNGNDYPGRPGTPGAQAQNAAIVTGPANKEDEVSGGGAPANLRIMASIDYAINANFLAGLRAGIVLLTYPGSAAKNDGNRAALAPIHLELRGTYVIGKDALAKAGFAPFVFVDGGISTWEAKVSVKVAQTGQPAVTADAWSLTGPGFVGLGGGARYAFTPKAALVGALRFDFAFGGAFVPNLGPEIGFQYGF